ncbi:MAG: LacI family DNA-binding transcriptional regulator [Anaerolineae bacterium]|nr:LacI family transcriptional regulator [Chloroflexota bacterium]MBV6435121.1 Catabolite control protein A [Anaerolineae bacterium]MDL1914509.1 LacI family transcriptional regulator [Anaerolineae bacterium CFX4]MCO6443372.1 LacI family DNA-binding transcriptional regulator [Anaerolineae bacterium]RIK21675.1 MAG: LacI family transcriptional regulator [Chloroflexota bacterium]
MASMTDVARRAGVSIATVSRVLAGSESVNAALRDRVLTAVRELNYRPNKVARSLRVQKSTSIGLIIPDIQNSFYLSIVRAVEDVAFDSHFRVFLCNSDEDVAKEALYLSHLDDEQIAGVILVPAREKQTPNTEQIRHLAERAPVVLLDRRIAGLDLDTILTNNVDAAYDGVTHLVRNGHRSIGAILGVSDITTGRERFEGYVRALADAGIPYEAEYVRQVVPKEPNGYAAAQQLLALPNPPSAIFTGNCELTAGVLRAVCDLNLNMPSDIALAGFDDMPWNVIVRPGITAIAQPTYELGHVAATVLMERIAKPAKPLREIVLKSKLVVRKSSQFTDGSDHA